MENVSWYDIWEAAVAINGMCVRRGQTGKATDLGELRLSDYILMCTALTILYRRKRIPLHQDVGSSFGTWSACSKKYNHTQQFDRIRSIERFMVDGLSIPGRTPRRTFLKAPSHMLSTGMLLERIVCACPSGSRLALRNLGSCASRLAFWTFNDPTASDTDWQVCYFVVSDQFTLSIFSERNARAASCQTATVRHVTSISYCLAEPELPLLGLGDEQGYLHCCLDLAAPEIFNVCQSQ